MSVLFYICSNYLPLIPSPPCLYGLQTWEQKPSGIDLVCPVESLGDQREQSETEGDDSPEIPVPVP